MQIFIDWYDERNGKNKNGTKYAGGKEAEENDMHAMV